MKLDSRDMMRSKSSRTLFSRQAATQIRCTRQRLSSKRKYISSLQQRKASSTQANQASLKRVTLQMKHQTNENEEAL